MPLTPKVSGQGQGRDVSSSRASLSDVGMATALALLLALVAWPLVAMTLGAVDLQQRGDPPASAISQWSAAAGAVFVSALVAGPIGGLVVRDVDAMVLPDEALSENLLGLSFLSKLKRFEYANGKMVLEQ